MYSAFKNTIIEPVVLKNNSKNINNNRTVLDRLVNNNKDSSLQTWASKDAAVYTFAMRPIINPIDYFKNIRAYLNEIVINDSFSIVPFSQESFQLVNADKEPMASFVHAIRLNVTDKINTVMANACGSVDMFNTYNPINESFVVTDIRLESYVSLNNNNHYYHIFTFAASNTTRYNTIQFKGSVYQDTSDIIESWDLLLSKVKNSIDTIYMGNLGKNTKVYFNSLDFANNYSEDNNINISNGDISWNLLGSLENFTFNDKGLYEDKVSIRDTQGPGDIDSLIKDLSMYYV